MNEQRCDELRRGVSARLFRLHQAAAGLLRALDDPAVSIEQLRSSAQVEAFRRQTRDCDIWIAAAAEAQVDKLSGNDLQQLLRSGIKVSAR